MRRISGCIAALALLAAAAGAQAEAEVEVLHGATLHGGSPPSDVVVIRGSRVGGALPDPEAADEPPRSFLPRIEPEQRARPVVGIVIRPQLTTHVETRWAYPVYPRHRARGRAHAGRQPHDPVLRIAPREEHGHRKPRRTRR
jgi:hypothetical protein